MGIVTFPHRHIPAWSLAEETGAAACAGRIVSSIRPCGLSRGFLAQAVRGISGPRGRCGTARPRPGAEGGRVVAQAVSRPDPGNTSKIVGRVALPPVELMGGPSRREQIVSRGAARTLLHPSARGEAGELRENASPKQRGNPFIASKQLDRDSGAQPEAPLVPRPGPSYMAGFAHPPAAPLAHLVDENRASPRLDEGVDSGPSTFLPCATGSPRGRLTPATLEARRGTRLRHQVDSGGGFPYR